MNRQDVLPLLCSKKTYQELRIALLDLDEVELFHGLFEIAAQTPYQKKFVPILDAGRLLLDLNPTCRLSCKEAIRDLTLPGWNVSLEEVPWYLYKQFGIAPINEAISQLRAESPLDKQHVYLDTIKYWSDIAHETGIEVLEERLKERLTDEGLV